MTKYIVMSIDVGISNLSYCFMQFDFDSDPNEPVLSRTTILDWETIRVAPPIAEYKCSGMLKTGKPCTHKAIYMCAPVETSSESGVYTYTCKSHTSKDGIAAGLRKPAALQKLDIPALTELYLSIATGANVSIPTTKRGLVQKIMELGQSTRVTPIPKQGAARFTPMHIIGANIIEQMDARFRNRRIDYVVIENQIGPLATKMKAVQAQLTMYFLMRQNGDVHDGALPKGIVEGVSATNKLKDYVCLTANYDDRKQSSVDICAVLVSTHFPEYQTRWLNCKKKDDMADSLLQGLWYIRHKIIKQV